MKYMMLNVVDEQSSLNHIFIMNILRQGVITRRYGDPSRSVNLGSLLQAKYCDCNKLRTMKFLQGRDRHYFCSPTVNLLN